MRKVGVKDVKESDFVLAERRTHDTDLRSCNRLDSPRHRIRSNVLQEVGMAVARMDHDSRS
jgi:hypothetical protein